MINVSNEFKQALYSGNKNYLNIINMELADDTNLVIENDKIMENGIQFEDAVGEDESFSALGSAVINGFTLVLNNIYDDFSDYNFTDAKITRTRVGLQLSETIEYIDKGVFTVEDTNYNGAFITLSCIDNMHKFDKPYSESTLIYPATLDTIVRNLCTVCGVTLASSSLNFPRKDYVIQTRPSDKATTCREVLSWCATIAGCFARCDRFGELELRWFDQNNMHTLNSLYSQNISVDDVVITQIQAEVKAPSEDASESIQTYTSGTAGYAIKIAKNDFITPTNAQFIVNTLGNELIGTTFRKANVSHSSDPTIEAGDCGTVIDRKENEYPILITRTNFKVGASQTTVCGAETPARNSAARYTEVTKSYVELRERIKKIDNPYAQAMADLAAAVSSASGMYKTEVTQPGGGVITYWHNKPILSESDIQIMISDVGYTFTNNGTDQTPTWYGFTMDGDILASVLDVVGINAEWINTGQLVVKDANQNETLFVDVDTGTVRINASQLSINSQTINSMVDEASGLTLQTPYTWSNNNQTANFSAIVYQGKEDITSTLDASWFEWYLRKEGSETRIAVGKTVSVNKSDLGYGGTIVCKFTTYDQTTPLQTRSGAALETRSGNQLSTFSATATGEQKITDLPTKTASQIDPLDNLLGIDAAEGYQTSIQFFTDYVLETQTRTINGQTQTVVASINALGTALMTLTGRVDAAEGAISALDLAKVNRSGDTMTGVLTLDSSSGNGVATVDINTAGDTTVVPSSNQYLLALKVNDKNGVRIGTIHGLRYTSDLSGIQIEANRSVNGSSVNNSLCLFIAADGTRSVGVTDAAIWRSAIGAVNKAGDTMTDNLTIQRSDHSQFVVRSSSIKTSLGTTVPSSLQVLGGDSAVDADGRQCFYSEICKDASDNVYKSFIVRRYSNDGGTTYTNGFYLYLNSSGSPSIGFPNTNVKNAWLSALGINISNYVKGMSNVVIRDTTHKYTIAAHSHIDFSVDLTTLGATLANQMVGFSVLCDNNANLIVTMCSASGNSITFRVHNPTASSQTMGGVVGILKYLSK